MCWILCSGALASAATVTLFTGETLTGEITLGVQPTIRTSDSSFAKLESSMIQHATFGAAADDFLPGAVLRNGARIVGPVTVAPEQVAWWIYQKFTSAEARAIPSGKTGALLVGGDFFEGTVRSVDGSKARVLSPVFGLRIFDAKNGDVHAVVTGEVKPATGGYEIRTTRGVVLQADAISFDSVGLVINVAGRLQTIPLAELAEVRAGAARFQALSSLQPARIESALGSPAKSYALDTLLDGTGLRVGPDSFPAGVAAWTNCAVSWAVPQGMGELIGRVGVAPSVAPNVRLAFVIYADGRSVWRSQPLTSGDSPQVFRAPLGAARSVALRVEPQFPSSATGTGVWIAPAFLKR